MVLKNAVRVSLALLVAEAIYFLFVLKTGVSLSLVLIIPILLLLYFLYKKTKKESYLFLLLITILASICYLPYLSNYKLFCFDNDHYSEYEYFYKEWDRLVDNFLENGSYPFYSFNSFLGNNYFASKTFHLTGDVLYPLMRLFPTINEGIAFQAYILVIISSIFMMMYLNMFGIKKKNVIYVTTFFFAFGGLAFNYISPIAWKRFYSFLPLILYAIEKYRETNKSFVLSIAIFLGLITNYYFMFPTTIFIVMYFIFTYYFHDDECNIKKIIRNIPKALLAYIIGFLLSGVIIIPTILFMSSNARVGSGITNNLFYDIRVYIGYIYNMIVDKRNATFDNFFTVNDNGHLSQYTLYINSIVIPTKFSYLFIKRKDNKQLFTLKVFVILLLILPLIPAVSSIMHGFSETSLRWLFLPGFIYLLGFAVFFDQDTSDKKIFIKGLTLYSCVFVVVTIVALVLNIMPGLNNFTFVMALVALLINYVYAFLISKNKLVIVMFVSCCLSLVVYVLQMKNLNEGYSFYEDSLDRKAISYLQDQSEDKFYRIDVDNYKIAPYTKPLNLNQSLNYGFKSVSAYDSTYEGNLKEFLEMNGIYNHIIKITNPECLRMLGVKYFYVNDESELPRGYNFTYITNNNNWKVYQLDNFRPVGFTYSKFTDSKENIVNKNSWNDELYVFGDLKDIVKDINESESVNFILNEYYDDNNLKGTIDLKEKQMLFFSIPYNDGWKIRDNGQPIKTYKVQGGFIGVVLEPGNHYLELNFTPPGFKAGVICSGLGGISLVILIIIENKKKKSI